MRVVAAVVVLALAASCGGSAATVTVFAAASLNDVMRELATDFEADNPGVRVVVSTAGSQQLTAQIRDGAPADVFVPAHPEELSRVEDRVAGPVRELATTHLVIAVEPGNPHRITSLADLTDPDLAVVLAAEAVPAGRYTRRLLTLAGVDLAPDSEELDVRAVAGRVALGEADAGIVYATDVVAADGRLEAVPVGPAGQDLRVGYTAAVLSGAAAAAHDLLAYLGSPHAQAVLARHGFDPPR